MNATTTLPGNKEETLAFAVEHWVKTATEAIQNRGSFRVALSGGSTPKAIYQKLSTEFADKIDWSEVHLFWGDERTVSPDHPDSNYKMAMDAGFSKLPIPENQIHRMVAEKEIEANARAYEKLMQAAPLDLVMLGMGEDGHTASLFPNTAALNEKERLVLPNHVPQKETMRMTLTFPCINRARNIVFYVLGDSKKEMIKKVFTEPEHNFPSQLIGTPESRALWILDLAAAGLLEK
ncbi:MAG: 6-phosphogluconolactonase [Candidatus Algichlamydia australiensis]|nr:6-phosphogluconolactonase [Chlamydiales bacterium]